MRVVQVGGSLFLAVSLAVYGDKHVEVATYHGEPSPSSPFVWMSTLSGTAPSLSAYLSPSHMPQ
jgi:hypothetical protein